MNRTEVSALRAGVRVKRTGTNQKGLIVPPPRGESVELGRVWVDLGGGPEQVEENDLQLDQRLVRLTVRHNPDDPSDDLTVIARLRRDLWAHSPVEVEPDNPFYQTRRDKDRNAYFEFATEFPGEVERVLREYKYGDRVRLEDHGEVGLVCARCGCPTGYVIQCPNCKFRDIEACPYCTDEVAREHYIPVAGDLFICPKCRHRVRLEFNPELYDTHGALKEPLVFVRKAQG
jgi:hypothetical protein